DGARGRNGAGPLIPYCLHRDPGVSVIRSTKWSSTAAARITYSTAHIDLRGCSSGVLGCLRSCCKATNHEPDERESNPRFLTLDRPIETARQEPLMLRPAERALDDPALRQDFEAGTGVGTLDHLDRDPRLARGRGDRLAIVDRVDEHLRQASR